MKMKTITHYRMSSKSSEGVTCYTKALGRGKLKSGQYITVFYSTGHIVTGKTSRDGKTVYMSLKNFRSCDLPETGAPRELNVVKVSILKTRAE